MSQIGKYSTLGTAIETLTGNSGGAVGPTGGNINVVGSGSITVVGDPGTSTLTISGTVGSETFDTDSGTATPSAGVIDIAGGSNINTSGATNVVTINLDTSITLPVTNATQTQGMYKLGIDTFMHNYGTNNTFLGNEAGNTTLTVANAVDNTGIGNFALNSLTTGNDNTALGHGTLINATTGASNTAVGSGSLAHLVSNSGNTGLGNGTLANANGGDNNLAAGSLSLGSLTTGATNTGLGTASLGQLTTGTRNIAIGYLAGNSYTTTESSNITIGNTGTVGESNKIRIGTQGSGTGQQNQCFVAGIYQASIGATHEIVSIDNNGQLGSSKGTDGQLLISSTAGSPAWATLTAGTGVSITNGANSITISASATAFSWNEITGTSQTMAVNSGYIANNVGLVTLTLPSTASLGDTVRVTGKGTGGWKIAQNAGQTIYFGTSTTTTGVGGSLASTQQRDTVELVCITANNDWNVLSSIGNITVV